MIFDRFQPRQFLTCGYILVYCNLTLLYYNNLPDPYTVGMIKRDKETTQGRGQAQPRPGPNGD
jgi:hypothetical protein